MSEPPRSAIRRLLSDPEAKVPPKLQIDPRTVGQSLSVEELLLIEQRVTNGAKSTGAAYLLWFFLFFVSGHRFYLGRPGTALLQIASYFVLIGFVWWVIDAFLIPGMVQQQKYDLRQRMMAAMEAGKSSTVTPQPSGQKAS